MSVHKEINFESEICGHLSDHGRQCSPSDDARRIHCALRLRYPPDKQAWATEPVIKQAELLCAAWAASSDDFSSTPFNPRINGVQ